MSTQQPPTTIKYSQLAPGHLFQKVPQTGEKAPLYLRLIEGINGRDAVNLAYMRTEYFQHYEEVLDYGMLSDFLAPYHGMVFVTR